MKGGGSSVSVGGPDVAASVTVCTQVSAVMHVWCTRRDTHTRVTPNAARQREREARGDGLSVHVETACGVDSVISGTATRTPSRTRRSDFARRVRSAGSKVPRTIDGRDRKRGSTARDAPDRSIGASRDAGLHHRIFLLLRRTAAPGAADDDTSGGVQALQVHAVLKRGEKEGERCDERSLSRMTEVASQISASSSSSANSRGKASSDAC